MMSLGILSHPTDGQRLRDRGVTISVNPMTSLI
jgi:hypothetical protein